MRWHAFVSKINRPVVAILAVAAIAGYLRFVHLAYPEHRVFDEYYYTKSACIFLNYSNERCDINSADERFWRDNEWDTGAWVHPPLGKWMIAFGELAFGTESMGWRAGAAVTGTATVVLLAVIIQLLFASPIWTFAGGVLLATESLNLVQSRTGTLDIFVAFWVVLVFVFLLLDRRWIGRRTDRAIAAAEETAYPPIAGGSDTALATAGDDGSPAANVDGTEPQPRPRVKRRLPAPLWRPYRFAAGAAGGAAIATKWSGITAVVTAAALGFGWEVVRRRRFGSRSPFVRTLTTEGFGLVLALAITPAIVYLATWIPWFIHFHWDFAHWADVQEKSWEFHRDLKALNDQGQPWHAYFSPAWQWIVLKRPVYYYGAFSSNGIRQVIYAQGNPLIFWGAILAIPVHRLRVVAQARLARGLRRGDRRGAVPAVVRRLAAAVPVLRGADHAVLRPGGRVRASGPVRGARHGVAFEAVPAARGRLRGGVGDHVPLVLADPDRGPPHRGRLQPAGVVPFLDLSSWGLSRGQAR